MKLTSIVISLAALFSVASADKVRYNTFYDNPRTSLNNVACSNGANGLVTKGFTTFGSLPIFPDIGGASAVKGWNSTQCGSCWKLTYKGIWLHIIAIDTISDGFSISLDSMNFLTNGKAKQLDVIDVEATQVDKSFCNLSV
ncbi:immunomodulatory protein [Lactarius psammicola]|nr:immunomodulatory protein [Lactarius psammicola]